MSSQEDLAETTKLYTELCQVLDKMQSLPPQARESLANLLITDVKTPEAEAFSAVGRLVRLGDDDCSWKS